MDNKNRSSEPLYIGNSMYGVFVTGEKLETERVPFENLRVGDVTVILSAERPYVHRIVEIRQDGIVTMGDNNPVPDKILLTPDMKFERVCAAISLGGKRRTVANGKAGMRLFRINRFKRKIRTVSSRLWQVAERFAFWRIHAAGTVVFGSETHYYCGKIIVGRKSADGKIYYHRKWKKLLFKISER